MPSGRCFPQGRTHSPPVSAPQTPPQAAEDMLARVLTQYATAATREAQDLLLFGGSPTAGGDAGTLSARIMALADAPLFVILGLRCAGAGLCGACGAQAVATPLQTACVACLPCRNVRHVDATGARTICALVTSLASKGVYTLFAEMRTPEEGGGGDEHEMRRLLGAHGVTLRCAVCAARWRQTGTQRGARSAHRLKARHWCARGGAPAGARRTPT